MTKSPLTPEDLRHSCNEWDDLEIDGNDCEFSACQCDWGNEELNIYADTCRLARRQELDLVNELWNIGNNNDN